MKPTYEELEARVAALEAALPRGWTKINSDDPATLPEPVVVLAAYRNECGKTRVVRAVHIEPFSYEVDDHQGDDDAYDWREDVAYLKPGWYEWPDQSERASFIPETVTHWMPLPDHPDESESRHA